jgi:hypothetical protein
MDCTPHFTLDLPNIERDIVVNDGRTSKARVNCQSGYLRRCLGARTTKRYTIACFAVREWNRMWCICRLPIEIVWLG